MIKLTKKGIIDKFRETNYGKKIYKTLLILVIITIFLFVVSTVFYCVFSLESDFLTDVEGLILNILYCTTMISIVITCYFAGKRDGAIEQYKLGGKRIK